MSINKGHSDQSRCCIAHRWQQTSIAVAVAALALGSPGVQAVEFAKGNPDVQIRWDNTFKYNLTVRAQDIDTRVVADGGALSVLGDDADLGWERGDIVNNRIDVLSEFDFIWKENFGFRISGAAWYDHAYSNGSNHPGYNEYLAPNAANPNAWSDTWGSTAVRPGEFTDDALFLHYKGIELLDAFIFANFDIGEDMGFSFRAGRHTIYWGNSLFLSGAVHGIAGAMTTLDAAKGFTVPGTSAKELFRPTNKLSATFQFSQNLSMVGYYSFEFEEARLPQLATYQSRGEGLNPDTDAFATLQPGVIDPATQELVGNPRTGFSKTEDETPGAGEWGLGVNYYFENTGWDVGLYYLSYYDKLPQGLNGAMDLSQFAGANGLNNLVNNWAGFNNGIPANPVDEFTGGGYPARGIGHFNWVYKKDNKLLGLSLANEFWGISFGSDFVYRKDVALNTWLNGQLQHVSNIAPDMPAATNAALEANLTNNGFSYDNWDYFGQDPDNYPGAVGDTWHIVFNGVGLLSPTALWDGGAYSFEFTASSLISVSEHEELLNPNVVKGRVSSTFAFGFTPVWYQIMPALDLKLRINGSIGMSGDAAPIAFGGTKGYGNGGVALIFEHKQVWQYDLRYAFNYGPRAGIPGNTTDRDNISFTVKRTF